MKTPNPKGITQSNIGSICENAALFQGRKEAGSQRDVANTHDHFNKSGTRDWSFDKSTARRCNFDHPRRSPRVKTVGGEEVAPFVPCSPATLNPGFGATVKQGCRNAVAIPVHTKKRVGSMVMNPRTGKLEFVPLLIERDGRMVGIKRAFDEVHFMVYGKSVTFSRCAKFRTVKDSRNEKRRLTLAQAESELHRMLGRELGSKSYAELTAGLRG